MARIENDQLIVTRADVERVRDVAYAARGTSRENEERKRSGFDQIIDEYIAKARAADGE